MIHYQTGNLLESDAYALVNTVNTVGVMGKGIALQFKRAFPENYKHYKEACKNKQVSIGNLLVTEEICVGGNKLIINFPTKTNWKYPSEYNYIEKGLSALVSLIKEKQIRSIAIPPLGAGNGGLDWSKVNQLIIDHLSDVDSEVYVYEPTNAIKEVMKKERVKLTPARAMLLSVLFELVRNGEFVSEFAAEKIAYFLQRFGAQDAFKLTFRPNFYGPYSGKVRHVLYYLNGSYITGYSTKDKKPFEELGLVIEGENDVADFLSQNENHSYLEIVEKTKKFLKGFYSPFGMELLSSIDFIKSERNKQNLEDIIIELSNWSDRKKTLFTKPEFIKLALANLNQHLG